jgi:hypothetical protein
VQAQLFAVSSNRPDVNQHTRSSSQVNTSNYLHGSLDVSTNKELSQDLLNNWDEHYLLSQFKPCTDFQGLPVHPDANRQIQRNQFNQVPLIKILVKTLESLFPHLSI